MIRPTGYNESLLHWLWKNRYLRDKDVKTEDGKVVEILHPGYANRTDGPDFTNARIRIGSLLWHGDIEIHWSANDWYQHKHHTDENYNGVILHVVFEKSGSKEVKRQDKTPIPALYMESFLPKPLQYFFQHYRKPDTLPCSGNLPDVPIKILEEQFSHAHEEYFEQKVNDLLEYYDATLSLSEAWKKMFIISLFDGLGISHNRAAMRMLAEELIGWYRDNISANALTKYALNITGIEPDQKNPKYNWKYKGSRPANHPETRIRQGCQLLNFAMHQPFEWWIRTDIEESFHKMMNSVHTIPAIGSHRAEVLFGIVFAPAFYILGNLTGKKGYCENARKAWINHSSSLPGSINNAFKRSGLPSVIYSQKLGSVHQYRAYCKTDKCEQCKVFNFIISS